MPTSVDARPTPTGEADRAHPVGVMCRERGRATLSLPDMGSEGVFPGLVATDHPRDSGTVKKGETTETKAVTAVTGWRRWLPWALVVAAAVIGLVSALGPSDGQRIYPLLVVFALAFVGAGVLRRQTLREFPAG
jgi:hypothetical protein